LKDNIFIVQLDFKDNPREVGSEGMLHALEGREMHTVLAGKPEGKRPLGRQSCRWENNTNMDL
jgi:hypothetical protein